MILLKQIMPIENPSMYKIHVAKYSDGEQPLDVYINSWDNWVGWNRWRSESKNRFTRKYVISFIHFYPQPGTFLFGGIFEILKTYSDHYDIRLCEAYKDYIGRLKVRNIHTTIGSSFRFEKHYDNIEVIELLDKAYSTHVFPGYEYVNYPFTAIKNVIEHEAEDWKAALSNIKGVYMLTDTNNGKRYIGSAYGVDGIWSRWSNYISNGHGDNDKLKELVNKNGYEYVQKHFMFTILEIHSMLTRDTDVINREEYWKQVMLSTNEKYGYNKVNTEK